nr:MAG TPA: hypothetical protein [Caudoviricetes sp.]
MGTSRSVNGVHNDYDPRRGRVLGFSEKPPTARAPKNQPLI